MEDMKNIKYTCIVDTTYALSVYLLYQSMEQIEDTLFFLGPIIPNSFSNCFSHVVKFEKINWTGYNVIKFRLMMRKYHKIISKTHIFCQDHITIASSLISRSKYTLIEDAPNIFTTYKSISFMEPQKTWGREYIHNKLLYGSLYRKTLGRNNQCERVLYTSSSDSNSPLLKSKNAELINLKNLWMNSTPIKKEMIYNIFGIEESSLNEYSKSEVILFSQPLISDCQITKEEMIEIYSPYIERYRKNGIIVKPHPRDSFDYKKTFPYVKVMKCAAPMQILSAMGMSFKVAITVCSSAVSSMDEDCEIIWIGAKVNPKVYQVYGDIKSPR